MKDAAEIFIQRIDRLELRFKRDKRTDVYLMPRNLMVAIRDILKRDAEPLPPLFAAASEKKWKNSGNN